MNFLQKLFGSGNKFSQFSEADALIVKITAGFLVWHYEKASETSINKGNAAEKYSKLYVTIQHAGVLVN